MRVLRDHVPTCPRAKVAKACQNLIFTYRNANVPINVPTCQRDKVNKYNRVYSKTNIVEHVLMNEIVLLLNFSHY